MLQEQADWYQGRADPCETTISFCIVNSERCQTSEMEIFAKINNGYFYKRLHLYMFHKALNVSALEIVIFVIKPDLICTNNNPELQNAFKNFEVASKQKALLL